MNTYKITFIDTTLGLTEAGDYKYINAVNGINENHAIEELYNSVDPHSIRRIHIVNITEITEKDFLYKLAIN